MPESIRPECWNPTEEPEYYVEAKAFLNPWKDYLSGKALHVPSSLYDSYRKRDECIAKYSFAIPNRVALYAILNLHRPVIEIGAGTGYWAYCLNKIGVDIVAFDTYVTKYNCGDWGKKWFEVQNGGIEQVAKHQDRTLFLCWPDMSDMATKCLQKYRGKYFIYIGENDGGCNAEGRFFKLLDKRYDEHKFVELPQWDGIHDNLVIYKRKIGGI